MKRLYPPKTFFKLLKDLISSRGATRRLPPNECINRPFIERIMMAVTQVNGCRYCSYFHTKVALKAGMEQKEIDKALLGDFDDAPEEELAALFFAQHYAEKAGEPDEEALNCLINEYGQRKSNAILAYIRAIMIGNAWGNMFDSIGHRITGKPCGEMNIFQEIGVITGPIWMIPIILIQMVFLKNS